MLDSSHNFYSKLQSTGNYLLIKDDVGKSKPATRILPSNGFCYGIKVSKDREDARAVISSWAQNSKKVKQNRDQDFRKLNILSVGEKFVTAPQQRAFRKTAHCRRMSSETPHLELEPSEVIYGMPLRPSTPIKAVIGNFYGSFAAEQKHRAYSNDYKSHVKRKRMIEKPEKVTEAEPKLFKMKKFLSVKARTSTRRTLSSCR